MTPQPSSDEIISIGPEGVAGVAGVPGVVVEAVTVTSFDIDPNARAEVVGGPDPVRGRSMPPDTLLSV